MTKALKCFVLYILRDWLTLVTMHAISFPDRIHIHACMYGPRVWVCHNYTPIIMVLDIKTYNQIIDNVLQSLVVYMLVSGTM